MCDHALKLSLFVPYRVHARYCDEHDSPGMRALICSRAADEAIQYLHDMGDKLPLITGRFTRQTAIGRQCWRYHAGTRQRRTAASRKGVATHHWAMHVGRCKGRPPLGLRERHMIQDNWSCLCDAHCSVTSAAVIRPVCILCTDHLWNNIVLQPWLASYALWGI